MGRLESLDYLRGAMALSVMVYHYVNWSMPPDSLLGGESVLGRLGIYAVSIFYVLSGLSLTMVYQNRIDSVKQVYLFALKRVFRIFPLFWLATSMYLIFQVVSFSLEGRSYGVSFYSLFMNYSLLFGFFDHDAYLITGGWSIGNELVFYACLPMILWLNSKWRYALFWFFALSCICGVYYAFFALTTESSLVAQWETYITPFNQLFLFAGGILVGVYGSALRKVNRLYMAGVAAASCLLFCLWPASGDQIQIVCGINRVIFTLCCLSLVLAIYVLNPVLKPFLARVFGFFGEACYSIYILHPLVAAPLVFIASKIGLKVGYAYGVSFFATLLMSGFCFRYVERPMIAVGRRVVGRVSEGSSNNNALFKGKRA